MRAKLTSLLLLVATLGLFAYQQGVIEMPSPAPAAELTGKPASSSAGTLDLGATTGPLARNWWRPWQPAELSTVNTFERQAGKHAAIVMWYADWAHNARPLTAQLNAIERRGSTPEITWEPWDASKGLYTQQPRYALSNIIDGKFDAYIRTWARTLAHWKHPVLLRFAQEMDGNWFPWDDYSGGNHPGQFVQAWRHVHRIFDQAGATNVKWVWSPAFARSSAQFPGTGYVDVMATTCQNGGRPLFARGWKTFAQGCGRTIDRLHALEPRLPIQLAETASAETGGSKARWISEMWSYLAARHYVTSMVWFNLAKETNWRIDSSPSAERAFAAGARSPRVN
ncbi:MAG TPA: glycosyl hydrolase [Candidatus Dormibacteraeota bacterium]|nr:glycosyl hydrolase [Candidatus Dormibacteraeota bacterium]